MIDVFVIKGFNIYSETLNYITYIFININIEISINIKDRTGGSPFNCYEIYTFKFSKISFYRNRNLQITSYYVVYEGIHDILLTSLLFNVKIKDYLK